MNIRLISIQDAEKLMARSESHFFDFKSKRIAGKKLQKTVVAMANAEVERLLLGSRTR